MGRKIFVSYKYADSLVQPLANVNGITTVRNYVDILQNLIEDTDNINKGENDGEDLGSLADTTISTKLGDKIFDSSVTIVFISKGMKDIKAEKDQWIPWEVSYSLREQSRSGRTSKTNAVLAVVLPDENGYYDYFISEMPYCNTIDLNTRFLFDILSSNMFNKKEPDTFQCKICCKTHHYGDGEPSYIKSVKWCDFNNKKSFNRYIEDAISIKENMDAYDLRKRIP